MPRIRPVALPLAILSILLLSIPSFAQQPHVLITQNVDEGKLATLTGNTRPEVNKKNDRGLVAADFPMEHMLLQLKRPPEQERQLLQYIEELQEPSSRNFHHWLTAKEYGERFGLATQDLDVIRRWLESHGFKVNVVYENGILIDFSGTAGQVQTAFHTEIHRLDVSGAKHFANMSDPRIPAALAPAIVGVVSLHDFKPHTNYKARAKYTDGSCEFGTCYLVGPGDLATIYNLNPLFTAGNSGQGQTIVVVEDTDLYSTADWTTFRSAFGLSSYTSGALTQVHPAPPTGTNNCADPGVNGDDGEAILDAEYASAAAPSATIELASCNDTATFGGLIAIQNLLNESATPPAIMSMSYGECEAFNGAASNAAFNSAFQQAVGEGVSVFVSSGDEGAASCDANANSALHGIGVSAWASSPYDVAVGGTDFGDTLAGNNSTYWSATNSSTYESALSYVPEIPWNDSCASEVIAQYLGYSQTYGTSGLCGTGEGLTTASGSGGPSGCATGSPSTAGVVSGSCQGWPKPSYQSLFGNPSDGVRDIPDVSLFAANGVWDHFYPFCYSDPASGNGGTPCTGAPDNWSGGGGTSFSTPIMAGIQALVNQKTGARQGNPNTVYYSLAAAEYGASGDTSCNSSLGNAVGSSCIFYDVTLGDMDVNCLGSHNCYLPSGTNGVLSTSNGAYLPAYGTTTGWDFATGIGTVNATNLANSWPGSLPSTTTSLQSSENPSNLGDSVTFTATVVTTGTDTPTGTVTFKDGTTTLGTGFLGCLCNGIVNSATTTYTTSALTAGSHSITAVYGGDSNNAGSASPILTQVVDAPDFTLTNTGASNSTILAGEQTGSVYSFSVVPTSGTTFVAAVTFACSFSPADPTLTNSSCTFNPASIAAGSPASAGSNVTVSVTTLGPNQSNGVRGQQRRRADNRLPWLPLTLPLAGIVMFGFAGRKLSRHAIGGSLCLALVMAGLLVACGGGGGSSAPPAISVSVAQGSPASIFPNSPNWPASSATFTASVANDAQNQGVSWSCSPSPACGSASSFNPSSTASGSSTTYTAPTSVEGLPSSITITATSKTDGTKSGHTSEAINAATVPGVYTMTVTVTESTHSHNLTPAPTVTVQ